jgi:two-component system sensor kinase FixL
VSLESRLEEPGMAVILVSDSGPGIDPNRSSTLFDPFVSSKPAGLGLGLTICRTIVDAHGGTISVSPDEELGGAAFRVSLPLG